MELQPARLRPPGPPLSLRALRAPAWAAVALACAALVAVPAAARAARSEQGSASQALTAQPTLLRPSSDTVPPPGHVLSAREAKRIAAREPKLRREVERHEDVRSVAYAKGPRRWQVSWFSGDREVAQVIVDERRGEAVEVWTGPQVSWQMARGVPGAFGRRVNSVAVWLPLCLAFFVPFFDPRRPFRLVHLDLLVLLAFSVSHVFFNRGEIYTSVPLVYPVLAYLLVRLLMGGWGGLRGVRPAAPPLLVPLSWLALGLVFLVGFRIGLNLATSNVIDVGYSGVIGADLLADGRDLYGGFPSDNPAGDTYGPVAYYAYVPFETAFPWSGRWDELPAAHAAALFFDLATLAALFWVGRRLAGGAGAEGRDAGNRLGVVLAYAWAAYPYTAFVSNSNANDSLVALLVVLSFGAIASAPARGLLLALASATKFAPAVLFPLYAAFDRRRARDALVFAGAFALTAVLVVVPVVPDGGLAEAWERTLGFQADRESPFSIWGQESWLKPLRPAALVAAGALALATALFPRRKGALEAAALGAAVLVALQIAMPHWFYLYIVWWFPLAIIAFLARGPSPAR